MTLRTLLDRFDLLMNTPESVPKLRKTILQLAVQGRLTERDPDDMPAKELLEEIRAKKKRLYEAGEIRKPKSFNLRPPSDSELFQIPESWEWVQFIDLYESVSTSGKELKTEEYQSAGKFPIIDQGKEKVAGYTNDVKKVISISRPVIIFGDHTREIKYVDFDFSVGSQGVKVFNIYPPTETRYLYWALHALNVEDQGYRRHYKLLKKRPFPIPPLDEQQRIVETVDRLMDECDALEQQQERERTLQVQVGTAATEELQSTDDPEALRPAWERVREHFDTVTATPEGVDALRQAILQLAVQGRLTERNPEDTPADVLLDRTQQEKQRLYDAGEIRKPGNYSTPDADERLLELPPSWQWTRIGSICLESLYGPRYNKDEYVEEGIPTIRTTDMTERGEINLQDPPRIDVGEEELEKHRVLEGDLLVTRSGSIGTMAVFRHGYEAIPSAYLIRFRFPSQVVPEFVRTYLNSPYGQDLLGLSENSTAQPNVNGTSIKEMQFPLPSTEEQQRIIDTVNHLLSFCDDLEDLLSETGECGEQLLEAALRNASADRQDAVPAEAAT